MADIISPPRKTFAKPLAETGALPPARIGASAEPDLYWYVEAFFFAYRSFTGDPDRILDEIGFGRAHHRVLHFVHRYPGLRVADLLDILQITKQSLGRVLRELIRNGYVTQRSGETDRRERHLYVTESGAALARRLAEPQIEKLKSALASLGEEGNLTVADFLSAMMLDADRVAHERRCGRGGAGEGS